MRKILACLIVSSVFFHPFPSRAELNLSSDPLWRALMIDTPASTAAPASHTARSGGKLNGKSACTATASCGSASPVSCSGSTTCTSVDQDCSASTNGYVICDNVRIDCPICTPDCSQYNFGSCIYSWNSTQLCCTGHSSIPGRFCPDACF